VAELATAQRGLVTRRQLRAIGLSRHAIDRRLKAARLHPLYRGIYLVGHSIPARERVSWALLSRAVPAPW
jgi:hypothetical protein